MMIKRLFIPVIAGILLISPQNMAMNFMEAEQPGKDKMSFAGYVNSPQPNLYIFKEPYKPQIMIDLRDYRQEVQEAARNAFFANPGNIATASEYYNDRLNRLRDIQNQSRPVTSYTTTQQGTEIIYFKPVPIPNSHHLYRRYLEIPKPNAYVFSGDGEEIPIDLRQHSPHDQEMARKIFLNREYDYDDKLRELTSIEGRPQAAQQIAGFASSAPRPRAPVESPEPKRVRVQQPSYGSAENASQQLSYGSSYGTPLDIEKYRPSFSQPTYTGTTYSAPRTFEKTEVHPASGREIHMHTDLLLPNMYIFEDGPYQTKIDLSNASAYAQESARKAFESSDYTYAEKIRFLNKLKADSLSGVRDIKEYSQNIYELDGKSISFVNRSENIQDTARIIAKDLAYTPEVRFDMLRNFSQDPLAQDR